MSLKHRKNLSGPSKGDDEILPLINIVFLLLIFFMTAGHLETSDTFDVSPPTSQEISPPGEQNLIVLIDKSGRVALNNNLVSDANIKSEIKRRLMNTSLAKVHIKTDGDTAASRIIEIMEILRDQGVKDVRLLTIEQEA